MLRMKVDREKARFAAYCAACRLWKVCKLSEGKALCDRCRKAQS